MRYETINILPDDLLKKCGFESANRGWVLKRTAEFKQSKPIQIHALPYLNVYIDLHADIQGPDGKHITDKKRERLLHFRSILEAVDLGNPVEISSKLLKKYAGLKGIVNLKEKPSRTWHIYQKTTETK